MIKTVSKVRQQTKLILFVLDDDNFKIDLTLLSYLLPFAFIIVLILIISYYVKKFKRKIKNPGTEATRLFQLKHGIIFDDINTTKVPETKNDKLGFLNYRHNRKVI